MTERKLMKIPQDKNYLKTLVKIQPVVLNSTNALRYNFEMPDSGATAVVDLEKNGTYTFKVLPCREPRYVQLSPNNKAFEVGNLSNEAVLGLLDYFYKKGRLNPENENVFSITDEYRYLKTYLTGQPYILKRNNKIAGKQYAFEFSNNYTVHILHTIENDFELTVFDNTGKGRVELAVILDLPYSAKCLKHLTNEQAVLYLHKICGLVEGNFSTVMDDYTDHYLKYLDAEWDKGNYVNPDFTGYVKDNFWTNAQSILDTIMENEAPALPAIGYA